MSKSFLSLQEAVDLLDTAEDDCDCAIVILPLENQRDVTSEGKDDENLVERNLTVKQKEVFHKI